MKITVIGGGGFIGSAVVDRLLRDHYQITVLDRPSVQRYRVFRSVEQVTWHTGDFLNVPDLHKAMQGSDVVMHLASTTLPKSSDENPVYDVQTNVIGTLQILDAMVGLKVPRIIFISSGGTVYGNPVYLPVDEKHPTDPRVSYGVAKLTIEKYLLIYERIFGIRPIILRAANPYGERQRVATAQGVVATFIANAVQERPIEIWGDGTITRDFLHVEDLAEAFARAVHYQGTERVFNISSGTGVSVNKLIEMIERVMGRSITKIHKEGRAFDVQVSVLSNERARQHLAWTPKIGLDEGIARTVAQLGERR